MKKLILFCILTTALLLLGGCKAKEEAPEAQPPTPPVVEEPVQEEPGKLLSALECVDSKIQAVITNTGDAEATLAKDIKVIVNGLIVVDPECDKMTLASGESTFCTDLSGHITARAGKVNTIQLNLLRERVVEYVDCE